MLSEKEMEEVTAAAKQVIISTLNVMASRDVARLQVARLANLRAGLRAEGFTEDQITQLLVASITPIAPK